MFFFLWGYFHEKQRNWAPCQRRKHSGPESKVAICLRALCQQFSRITLSTTISVIKTWLRLKRSPRTAAGDRNSGWREMQSQRAFMWAKGVRRLQKSCLLWTGLCCPFGVALCRNRRLQKNNMPLLYSCKDVVLMYFMGCWWKFRMNTIDPIAVSVNAVWCWGLSTTLTATIITMRGRNETFAYEHRSRPTYNYYSANMKIHFYR